MRKLPLHDLVIFLPGITGSVLEDDKGVVWPPLGNAAWSVLLRRSEYIQRLTLKGDAGPDVDEAGDGLRATRLIDRAHLIPGFWKIDIYAPTIRLLLDEFTITEGTIPVSHPANFYQMPYDWRRDNRFNAYHLQRLIETALPKWREFSGARDAKVILVAHSMGGLVARYYLEVLEGWRDCKALISFGAPYRGSMNALNFLSNGYKNLILDVTSAIRSFPASYQLMPIYPVVDVDGVYGRVAETPGIPGIDPLHAADALRFHREIEEAVTRHENDIDYLKNRYKVLPFVGVRQKTLQSARLDKGLLKASSDLPAGIDPWFVGGDGTVPQISAVPIEMSTDYSDTFVPDRHVSLQKNRDVLDALRMRLGQLQASRGLPIRGGEAGVDKLALSVDVDDLYIREEKVTVTVRLGAAGTRGVEQRVNLQNAVERVEAIITPMGGASSSVIRRELERDSEDQWSLAEEGLAPGMYRLEIKASAVGYRQAPTPVNELFEVAEESA